MPRAFYLYLNFRTGSVRINEERYIHHMAYFYRNASEYWFAEKYVQNVLKNKKRHEHKLVTKKWLLRITWDMANITGMMYAGWELRGQYWYAFMTHLPFRLARGVPGAGTGGIPSQRRLKFTSLLSTTNMFTVYTHMSLLWHFFCSYYTTDRLCSPFETYAQSILFKGAKFLTRPDVTSASRVECNTHRI